MNKSRFFLLLILLSTTTLTHAVETDCNDPDAVAGWQALLAKHPTDHDLIELYQLRLSLCQQVESDSVSIEEAAQRFEQARKRLTDKWREHNQRRQQYAPAGVVGAG